MVRTVDFKHIDCGTVSVVERHLTDNSVVHNVEITHSGDVLYIIPAYDEKDAICRMNGIFKAFNHAIKCN